MQKCDDIISDGGGVDLRWDNKLPLGRCECSVGCFGGAIGGLLVAPRPNKRHCPLIVYLAGQKGCLWEDR